LHTPFCFLLSAHRSLLTKKARQATLAIACLFSHCLTFIKGGKWGPRVYSRH